MIDDDDDDFDPLEGAIDLPVDGTLDLHAFKPKDAGDLVDDYIEACREKGIFSLRIVHGKGVGALQRTVHAVLKRNAHVEHFELAPGDAGGWGATVVTLKK